MSACAQDLVNFAKTLPALGNHKVQVGTGDKACRQNGSVSAISLLKVAAEHVCFACSGSVYRDPKNWLQCEKACKGGAFYANDGSGLLHRMVDGLRYHMLKKEILSIDACSFGGGAGLPLIEFTAYGKTAASMKCLKCKATLSKSYLNDGVNFDLHGTTSHTGASGHSLNFD